MERKSPVRMGPISLLTLVIILCLAVLAVLSVTTAQATYSTAQKHASFTQDTYANERQAQQLVADIDAALAPIRASGPSQARATAAVSAILPDDAQIEGNVVSGHFTTQSGRMLDIQLTILANATYEITAWKATTQTDGGSDVTLWSGASTPR